MRPYARVRKLTEEEYGELKRWERSRTMGVSKVRRARVVLLSHRGLLVQEIAEKPRATSPKCQEVGQPLQQARYPGVRRRTASWKATHLQNRAREHHHPNRFDQEPDTLGLPFGAWTLDRLVAYLSEEKGIAMSRSRMSEIFRNEGLRWRQQEGWFGQRVDPDFAEKRGSLNSSTLTRLSTASSSA